MAHLSNLSELKESLTGDVAKQLRHVSLFNMCDKDHFPDENSCIVFAQGFGLIPTTDSQIVHCNGNVCRVKFDKTLKVGFKFLCRNKMPHSKALCLSVISPLQNTFFQATHFTIHDIFQLVMCFVSRLTVTQVVEQLSFSQATVLGWYGSCREVCKVILTNEYQGMIHREGELEVDESHLFLWNYGLGRRRKWDDDVNPSNDEKDENYVAENEYRRRYFRNMDRKPLPLEDKFMMFWYHVKLVFPGPGKVGLVLPITDNGHSSHKVIDDILSDEVNGDSSHKVIDDILSDEVNGDSSHEVIDDILSDEVNGDSSHEIIDDLLSDEVNGDSSHEVIDDLLSDEVNGDSSHEVNDSASMEAALDYAYEETVEELPSKKKKTTGTPFQL